MRQEFIYWAGTVIPLNFFFVYRAQESYCFSPEVDDKTDPLVLPGDYCYGPPYITEWVCKSEK